MTSAPFPSVPLHERLGITIDAMTADEVTGSMPVAGNTQPFWPDLAFAPALSTT